MMLHHVVVAGVAVGRFDPITLTGLKPKRAIARGQKILKSDRKKPLATRVGAVKNA